MATFAHNAALLEEWPCPLLQLRSTYHHVRACEALIPVPHNNTSEAEWPMHHVTFGDPEGLSFLGNFQPGRVLIVKFGLLNTRKEHRTMGGYLEMCEDPMRPWYGVTSVAHKQVVDLALRAEWQVDEREIAGKEGEQLLCKEWANNLWLEWRERCRVARRRALGGG